MVTRTNRIWEGPQPILHSVKHSMNKVNDLFIFSIKSVYREVKVDKRLSNIAESSVLSPRLHTNKPIITFVLFSPNY